MIYLLCDSQYIYNTSQVVQFFHHVFVLFLCDGACGGCSDEFSCESEQFLVGMFANICDDLRLRVCWIGVSGVCKCAGDADFADCLEFVCVAHDMADEGVVWREKAVVVEWCS